MKLPMDSRFRLGVTVTIAAFLGVATVLHGVSAQRGTPPRPQPAELTSRVVRSVLEQTTYTLHYDPSYVRLTYPGGDVPRERGVCTDVVIRAFRAAGVDLQREVHLDMSANFSVYPQRWGLRGTDRNIDHRRVPNLMTYFQRQGRALTLSNSADNFQPGDVVAWDLGGGVLHVGVVSNVRAAGGQRYQVVHNLAAGAKLEDVLFAWRVIGHYRYFPASD